MAKLYLVGGAVRDTLLGQKPKDLDYVLDVASMEALREWVLGQGGRIFTEKPEFGVIRALLPGLGGVDLALPRVDLDQNGRYPGQIEVGCGILMDLGRRDFRMNAMALEVLSEGHGALLDPHGGQEDLKKGLLRCVGNAHERFQEDLLRVLRAYRFAYSRNLELCEDILAYRIPREEFLQKVSLERVRDELQKMFDSPKTLWEFTSFAQKHPEMEFFLSLGELRVNKLSLNR